MKNQPEQPPHLVSEEKPNPTSRAWIIWTAVFAGIVLLMLFKDRMPDPGEMISQYRFEELVNAGQIKHATINYNPQNAALSEVVGVYYRGENGTRNEVPFRAKIRLTSNLESKLLERPEFEPYEPNTLLMSLAVSVLPFVIIAVLIWFFFVRQIRKSVGRTGQQNDRLDAVLSKWEEQGRRMDQLLDKVEKDHGVRP